MPNIRDLKEHEDGEDGEDGGLTIQANNSAVQRWVRDQNKLNMGVFSSQVKAWLDAERRQQERIYQGIAEAATAEARRKAADTAALRNAQRASEEALDLAKIHQQELAQLRKESDTTARKYFLYGVAVGAIFVLVGWLLSALSAAQVFSHLFHP